MTVPAGDGAGLLFCDRPAVVTFDPDDPDRVSVIDVSRAAVIEADGGFGAAIRALLRDGTRGPLLRSLGATHPTVQLLETLIGELPRPLSPAAALELDGFDTLFVELVGRCNERCIHCYAGAGPELAGGLDAATGAAIIDDAAALGFRRVQLTGGDPLLSPWLPDLAQRVTEHGMQCEVYTNGLALDAALLDRLGAARPAFAFSIYSHDPATHDQITRTPGSHRRTCAAIRAAVDRGHEVRVAMVVMDRNAHDVAATRDLLRELGVTFFTARPANAVGRGTRYLGEVDDPAPNAAEPKPRPDPGSDDCDSTGGEPLPPPRRGQGKLCVTYDGLVTPCIFNRSDVVGRVAERRLRDIARDPRPTPVPDRDAAGLLTGLSDRLSCRSCRLTACAIHASIR